ncbi:MAG: nucleoside hydrolase [Actinomycetota bacterium]|nr:nucleoside hydrolase [Actinomycetota bacterium]
MTVVAKALRRRDPITSLVWMGGAVAAGGNMTAAAEFDAWMDPAAADEVLTSGLPVAMVPLDLTASCRWSREDLAALAALGPVGALLSRPVGALCARDGGFVPHDAVTAIALLEPARLSWSERHVCCERAGSVTTGATVVDRRHHAPPPNARLAEGCDPVEIRAAIFAAIAKLAGGASPGAPSSAGVVGVDAVR